MHVLPDNYLPVLGYIYYPAVSIHFKLYKGRDEDIGKDLV